MTSRLRALVGKVGLDGHDRGAKVVARGLRDSGFEVIYTGLRQRPETIAAIAAQEDVDIIGVSILSGAHVSLCARLAVELADAGIGHVPLVVGGIIPDEDKDQLSASNVRAVFGPGSSLREICAVMRELAEDPSATERVGERSVAGPGVES